MAEKYPSLELGPAKVKGPELDRSDMSPSDIGLQGILEKCPLWNEYAISLGLSVDRVKYYLEHQQGNMRGLLALQYWRDGKCGSGYPTTWKFLLDVIKDRLGPNVAEDLKKLIIANDSWTLTSPRGLTGLSSPEVASFLCHSYPQSHASYSQSSVHSLSLPSECSNHDPHLLYLFHSLYNSQNSDLTQTIAQQLDQFLTFSLHLTPHDTLAIAHCLRKCTHLRDLRFTTNLNPLCLPHVFSILQANVHLQRFYSEVDHLSSADASCLISVTSVEKLYLGVRVTTLSALSAIFASTTIVDLTLNVALLKIDIDNEQNKLELIRSVTENTTLRKLCLCSKSYFMVPVLHGVAGNTTIEDLEVLGFDDDDVAEALATTCVANTKLRRVAMDYMSPLPVMKSLAARQVPLEEFRIGLSWDREERVFSEDELKEMETYAAEMKVVKVTFDVENKADVCDAISTGLARNQLLKQVTLYKVPEEKKTFMKSKLSSIKTVTVKDS